MSKDGQDLKDAIIYEICEYLDLCIEVVESGSLAGKIEDRIAAFESECIQQTREIILSAARSANVEGQ